MCCICFQLVKGLGRWWSSIGPLPVTAIFRISMKREEGLVQPHPSKKVTTLVQKMQDSEVVPKYLGGSGTWKDADNPIDAQKKTIHINPFKSISIHLNRIISHHFASFRIISPCRQTWRMPWRGWRNWCCTPQNLPWGNPQKLAQVGTCW